MLHVFRHDGALVAGRPVGPFAMNQYLVACPKTQEAALIDCGGPPDLFARFCEERSLRITRISLTHAHVDHVAGLFETRALLGGDVPIELHADDARVYASAPKRAAAYGFRVDAPPPPDRWFADGDTVEVGELRFDVWHTPGHCPGHVCFVDSERRFVLAGDLLFRGGVGRTDFPECEPEKMGPSLSRLMTLPDETEVYAGHMEPTTIGRERGSNPFFDAFGVVR
ncbi:MAG: MBL fold metallo-hydrolase [Myxococcales bacterium]|nr:MBL fold metallo-hydrolase [Myxococcales bacterium]